MSLSGYSTSLFIYLFFFCPGIWKRKRLNFCGSTLKKQAGSGRKPGSVLLFEEPEAEVFFVKHAA